MALRVKSRFRTKPDQVSRSSALETVAALDGSGAIAAVKAGLDARLVRQLAIRLALSLEELAVRLQLTTRTLHRRFEEGRLSLSESERVLGLIKIMAQATQTLGSEAKAVHWLKSPIPVLGGRTPLEFADTLIGLRLIEDILGRIEDVVYS